MDGIWPTHTHTHISVCPLNQIRLQPLCYNTVWELRKKEELFQEQEYYKRKAEKKQIGIDTEERISLTFSTHRLTIKAYIAQLIAR